tara:strand:- start:82 stop:666 length:585 start_codon:yes stop_codon:yes gene_type:complete
MKLSNKITGELQTDVAVKDICELIKPTNILEIGFNRGKSASMWLKHSTANLVSIDLRPQSEVIESINTFNELYPNRFEYLSINAHTELPFKKDEWVGKFDFIFIDSSHTKSSFVIDTNVALYFGAKYMAYDDYFKHRNSSFIQNYINTEPNIKLLKTWNNDQGVALVENLNINSCKGNKSHLDIIKNELNNFRK